MSSRISMSSLVSSVPPIPAMSSESTETPVLSNRLQLALLIGTPVVLGTGLLIYYYYYNKKEVKKDNKITKTKVKRVAENATQSETDSKVCLFITRSNTFDNHMNCICVDFRIRLKER